MMGVDTKESTSEELKEDQMKESPDGMLTAGEAAKLLNVHINTVRRWTNKGLLKAYRVGRRHDRRFTQQDIDHFLLTSSSSPRS